MAKLLARLGGFSARHRFGVFGAWALLLVVLGVGATQAQWSENMSMPDTPAAQALAVVDTEFPTGDKSAGPMSHQLVFVAPDGARVTDPAVVAGIDATIADAAALDHVVAVTDPFDPQTSKVSESGRVALADVRYSGIDEHNAQAATEQLYDIAAHSSVSTEVGGQLSATEAEQSGAGDAIGIVFAAIVLLITFGSLLAAGANLLSAVVGLLAGLLAIVAASSVVPISSTSIILAAMLGLAVGIDYTLFMLTRFRAELRNGRSVDDAIARTTGTAGSSIVFAGLTVIVALVGLSVVGLSFLTQMGMAGAVAIVAAVLMAITGVPAMMRALGRRVLPRRERAMTPEALAATPRQSGRFQRMFQGWANFVTGRPGFAALGSVIVLAVVAAPLLSMKTALSVPGGDDSAATQRVAYDLVVDEFGGIQSPLMVLVGGDDPVRSANELAVDMSGDDRVRAVTPALVSADGGAALLTIIPEGSPIDDSTKDLVHKINDYADSIDGAEVTVTGEAAIDIDMNEALNRALIEYIILIALLSFVILTVMFRSLLVPLLATVGYLLSLGAAFGSLTAVYQWSWLPFLTNAPTGDPLMSFLPVVLVGVLFGLAMDYQVFLVSRIREYHSNGLSPKEAVKSGFMESGPVIIAAAAIMIVVFAGFAASSFAVSASIAFGLAVGVAADALIVRMIIMPALLTLVGRGAWWLPTWLDRILPDLDVEGHKLAETDAPPHVEREVAGRHA